jgi:type II secretory pathway component PulF
MNNKIKNNSFNLSDQIFFAQRLFILLESNTSLVESIAVMRNIDKNIRRKEVYSYVISDLEKGMPLARSIKNLGLKFDHLLIVLIKNGEEGGRLSQSLNQAYLFLEKKNDIKKKIISSLVYPSFIVIATILMTLFLILYIFPKIIPLLSSLNIQLPLITRIVQSIYYFLISKGVVVTILLILLYISFNLLFKKYEFVRLKIQKIITKIPILSRYIVTNNMISVCRMGEMLLSSGKGLTDVLLFYKESTNNLFYKVIYEEIYNDSIKGISLSNSIAKHKDFFPTILIDMLSLGEKSGNLSEMFGHCSRIFEQDIDNVLKRFSSLIEPILMVLMGLIVGSIALSIILPVYEITNHISK